MFVGQVHQRAPLRTSQQLRSVMRGGAAVLVLLPCHNLPAYRSHTPVPPAHFHPLAVTCRPTPQ